MFFTILLGVAVFGYFYYSEKSHRASYPFINQKENTVLIIERNENGFRDTVSWLYRRVNLWRYFGTNLGLYQEDNDSLVAEFCYTKNRLQAVFNKIPFYACFDKSGQKYGVSIIVPNITDSSSWHDLNLGLEHKILKKEILVFKNKAVQCLVIETKLSKQAINIITRKLISRKDRNFELFTKIKAQSWLNWYSSEYGWLQTTYPDGKKLKVIEIKDIYWFERISRYIGYGVKNGRIDF